jgi:hypothetical protein
MHDDYRVTSELYRLMLPRKRAGSGDLGQALDAVGATGSLREALDANRRTDPDPADPDGDFSWPDPPRQWLQRVRRALMRMDTWMLIVAVAGVIATVAGAVVAYLAWVKPH